MVHHHAKRGVALPFTIISMIMVAGFVVSMSNLNQGLKNQIFHTNNHQLSFLMGYSAFSRVLAKIHSVSWANRPFAAAPLSESNVPLQGGTYDLFAENTPGKTFQADIYVRTHLAGIARMYFWRIKFNDDLLDVSNRILVECFLNGDPNDFPHSSGPSGFSQKIDNLLTQRAANQKKSDQLGMQISSLTNPKDILQTLNGRPPETFVGSYPTDPEEALMASKIPATYPLVAPPSSSELPTSEGPGPTTTTPGYPTIPVDSSPVDDSLNKLADLIGSSSKGFYSNTDAGWDAIEASGTAGVASLTESQKMADAAKAQAYTAMDQYLAQTQSKLVDAPSAETKKALEEMTSQTIVAGMSNISDAYTRMYSQFDNNAGDNYLNSLPTSAYVADLLKDWKAAVDMTQKDVDKLHGLATEIGPLAKAPEIDQKLTDVLTNMNAQLELIKHYADLAQARYDKLKAEEDAAAASNTVAVASPTVTP